MDYAKLIETACKRLGITEYALAQRLGYKSVSNIYEVKRGIKGMSAEKYNALLQLAYGRRLYIMSSPLDRLRQRIRDSITHYCGAVGYCS